MSDSNSITLRMGDFWVSFGDGNGHSTQCGPMSFAAALDRAVNGPRMPGQWAGVTDADGVCVFDAGWEEE